MFASRQELLTQFQSPIHTTHPQFKSLQTFSCLSRWRGTATIELPRIQVVLNKLDYLQYSADSNLQPFTDTLKFQQDSFRLWYQVDGVGILQNVTRNTFGTARPGLLGLMERGERHTYLHQKGAFGCFQMEFSLLPSAQAKCYWNTGIEGKTVLDSNERLYFENLIFDLFLVLSNGKEMLGLATLSRMTEILIVLFKKGLILIEESQFPKNKSKSLVLKAKSYMNLHYANMHHQEEIERECGVDINYLNIIFKKECGSTLYHYITAVRMEHAKHLLEISDISVADIALQIGYPNANSFSRAFKRLEQKTPQQHRVAARKPGRQRF